MSRPELGGYRIVRFGDAPEADGEAVLGFWRREGALPPGDDGRDRLAEVSFVALDTGNRIAGVSTVYLRRNERLRTEVWHLRGFVGAEHRRSALAVLMLSENRKYLEARFVAGEDTRGLGLLMEIENPDLKSGRSEAVWAADWAPGIRYTFIGENGRGDHLRIHWFPGARIPPPG